MWHFRECNLYCFNFKSVGACFPDVELNPALHERDFQSVIFLMPTKYCTPNVIPGFPDGAPALRVRPGAAGPVRFLSVQSIPQCGSVCSCKRWRLPDSLFLTSPVAMGTRKAMCWHHMESRFKMGHRVTLYLSPDLLN
jgi:hypothetical protein